MDRREFNASILGVAAMIAGNSAQARRGLQGATSIDGARLMRHLDGLGRIGRLPGGGIDRLAYSDADREAHSYVIDLMRAATLDVSIDAAGNIIGRRGGDGANLPPLMFGSHIDSVPNGGNYDGPVGSLSAIEVAHTLAERGIRTRHPLEVIIFENEEGGKTGSRAMSGELPRSDLDLVTHSGKTIGEGTAFVGGNPDRLDEVRRAPGDVAAYLELHVEQGGILEHESSDIGVVEGIVGIKRWNVTVEGFANHAGTTPMDSRQDALLAAAWLIDAVNDVVRRTPGRHVGTVGRIEAHPGAPNVIPGRVVLSLELRDLDMEKIESLYEAIRSESASIAERSGTQVSFDEFYVSRAAPTDPRVQRMVADAAADLNLSALRMPSGAGHDAQSIAHVAPIGMIFIPSVGGISHSPDEFSRPEDIVAGANVLLHTLLKLDAVSLD